jgi:ketosteroid isomerase-like protein
MGYPCSEILRAISEKNVEIVKRTYSAWEQGDFSAIDWADPEIEYSLPDPEGTVERGVEAMRREWGRFVSSFEGFRVEPREFIDAGDKVVVVQAFHGRGRASGVSIDEMPGAAILTVRDDGKVTRFEGYSSPEEALEAAGQPLVQLVG